MFIDVGFLSDAGRIDSFIDVFHHNAAPYVEFSTSYHKLT